MTRRSPATLSLTLALLASCTKRPDPVVVDPRHYKVEFENDRGRVLRATAAGIHAVENLSDTPMERYVVELKRR
jgi:hypothetical protein